MKRRLTRTNIWQLCLPYYLSPPGCVGEHASAEALDVSGFSYQMAEKSLFCAAGRQETGPLVTRYVKRQLPLLWQWARA